MMSPLEYYPNRASEFIFEGGILCIVVGGINNAEAKNILKKENPYCVHNSKRNVYGDTIFLFLDF